MIGHTLGHYRILEKIGAGGMGEVYRAQDLHLAREVAIKLLPSASPAGEAARKRFHKEAAALSKLNHPNIQTVHDFDTQEGTDFLVAEYIAGPTLAEKLAAGPLLEKEIVALGSQLAAALEEAHEQGIVHRDLKPGNIKVTPKGQLKVLDFGLATLLQPFSETAPTQSVTDTLQTAGTLPYMAPEQLRGEAADQRTDIWAAGCVLYEMATGRRPFDARLATALAADIQHQPPAPPRHLNLQISLRLEEIVLKCLEKDSGSRYQSAKELAVDLRRLSAPAATTAIASPQAPARGRPARGVWLAGLAATATVAALVGLNVGGLRERLFGFGASRIDSVAVLPLQNLMGDPAQDYFVEGMHEALITELSRIGALKVISRTSSLRYKATDKPLPQVARELNVNGIIEGSVLREGERVRITVQLIHAPTDHHVWARSFDRELRSVLTLHSEVAQAIAGEVKVTLTPQEQVRLSTARPVDPKAYELYVLGRHQWNQRTISGYEQAIKSLRNALELDPDYAPAHAALGDAYMLLGEMGGLSQNEARSLADTAIRRALELDPALAEAHASAGYWKLRYEWSWGESEAALRRAIQLNPSSAEAHQWYARSLAFAGRFAEAGKQLERARELDPLSSTISAHLGQLYLFARQYDRAAERLQKALELNPHHALVLHNLGELLLAQGRFAEATPVLQKSVELAGESHSHYLGILAYAYAGAGRSQDARKVLRELERRTRRGLASTFDVACLHVALGDKERALAWLEEGYERRDPWLTELKVWPWLDSLLPDPRFQDLLRRMNFPASRTSSQ
jgi:TolB-like protein/Tfp pilus assembly protein PilF